MVDPSPRKNSATCNWRSAAGSDVSSEASRARSPAGSHTAERRAGTKARSTSTRASHASGRFIRIACTAIRSASTPTMDAGMLKTRCRGGVSLIHPSEPAFTVPCLDGRPWLEVQARPTKKGKGSTPFPRFGRQPGQQPGARQAFDTTAAGARTMRRSLSVAKRMRSRAAAHKHSVTLKLIPERRPSPVLAPAMLPRLQRRIRSRIRAVMTHTRRSCGSGTPI